MHEDFITLSSYRLEQALEDYKSAAVNFENGLYRATANRAYYCVFHVIRSLLILSGKDFKSHSAVISAFRKDFIKTGIFDARLSKIVSDSSSKRNISDYSDLINISKEEAEKLLIEAKVFFDTVKPYVENLITETIDTF